MVWCFTDVCKKATPLEVALEVDKDICLDSQLLGGAQAAQTAKTVYKRLNGVIVKGYSFWIGIDERVYFLGRPRVETKYLRLNLQKDLLCHTKMRK